MQTSLNARCRLVPTSCIYGGLTIEESESELESGEESESELKSGEESETMATEPVVSLVNVQNPSKVVDKERLPKRRIISSIEKEQKPKQGKSSVYRSYKCGKCSQPGHNLAFHKKK
ncbi:hypothetical protein C2G38_2230861 [Gigaspora rosea]|uniref:Uncharacterized protein n=1 Tax=Gigaspora rosea TaxID=44941 RepID=A0A397U1Z9_9GLOM|nr:hypothetical protein C2G38_2230861 [Gigaspora rosea]